MARAVILQSHRDTGRPAWIDRCLLSVHQWAETSGLDYHFVGDEMMAAVPEEWRKATSHYPQIAADLGRLYLIRDILAAGAEQAIWIDADVVVFDPERFDPMAVEDVAFGREIWIDKEGPGGLRARHNVHNACMAFRETQPVLGFYIHAAERILQKICDDGAGSTVPPQIIGPKLLGALHSIVRFPLMDAVAMISPPLLHDIAGEGDGQALACYIRHAPAPVGAANLSASLIGPELIGTEQRTIADTAIDQLIANPAMLLPLSQRDETS